jgi:holo-[acyl-carrier protein] synthase
MILGIDSDLVDIRRIEKTIARHSDRFLVRVFTDVERAKAEKRAWISDPSGNGLKENCI